MSHQLIHLTRVCCQDTHAWKKASKDSTSAYKRIIWLLCVSWAHESDKQLCLDFSSSDANAFTAETALAQVFNFLEKNHELPTTLKLPDFYPTK